MPVKLKPDDIFSIPNEWLDIPRANNPKLKLSIGALRLLADVVFRLKVTKLESAIYEIGDLYTITDANKKPLKYRGVASILDQLRHIFDIAQMLTRHSRLEIRESTFKSFFVITLQPEGEAMLSLNQDFYNNFITSRRKQDVTYH